MDYKAQVKKLERARQHAIDARARLSDTTAAQQRENDPLLVALLKDIGAADMLKNIRRLDGMMVDVTLSGLGQGVDGDYELNIAMLYGAARREKAEQYKLEHGIRYMTEYWSTRGMLTESGEAIVFEPTDTRSAEISAEMSALSAEYAMRIEADKRRLAARKADVVKHVATRVSERLTEMAQQRQ